MPPFVLLIAIIFAFSTNAQALDSRATRRAAVLAAKDRRIRAQVAREPGAVKVRLADGKVRQFPAAADTDAARGAALNAVFALGTELRNSTVFLGPGNYSVTAGLRGWNGTKLWGSGRNATTIKMADGALSTNYFVFRCVESEDPNTGYRYSRDCEIQDMSVDANRQNQLPGIFYGVSAQLYGSNAIIRNVRAVNAGGNSQEEIFCLSIVSSGGVNGTFKTGKAANPLVENCEVNGVAPGFSRNAISVTGIAINGSFAPDPLQPGDGWVVNGRITNCSVHGNLCETGLQAFQFSWASRCIIENCTAYDNSGRYVWGFYHDTGSFHRVDIAHNRFLGVDIGARILCSPDSYHSDTTIFANEFRISGAANGSGKAGIEYAGSNRTGGIRVIANRILLAPTLAGSICVTLNSQSGALILVNMFAGFTTPVFLPNAGDTVVRGNLGEFGEPVGAGLGRSVP